MTLNRMKIFIIIIFCLTSGCAIGPIKIPAPSRFPDYQTQTLLQFPLKGESLIIAGGRTIDKNHHATSRIQRFALDIAGVAESTVPLTQKEIDEAKKSRDKKKSRAYSILLQGDPKKNESYLCFGREVIAPADGVVVHAKDGIADNIPGKTPSIVFLKSLFMWGTAGNNVVIKHENKEYSFFAHLKQNSIRVNIGQQLKSGDTVGECRNSGNSTGPHLHYDLRNSINWRFGSSLPAQFNNYYANGKFVNRGEPEQGQIIKSE